MKRLNFGIILACALVLCLSSCRQQSVSSRVLLNEICMENVNGVTDDYGKHSPWIELFVKYYGQVDVGGYAIEVEVEGQKPVRYTIPTGDVATQVQPRQHILFWADSNSLHGTLHTNFTLDPTKTTTFRLYDGNKDLIDEVTIPANTLKADQSWGRNGDLYYGRTSDRWVLYDNSAEHPTTAMSSNVEVDTTLKMKRFETQDPYGIGMAITAMLVVFSCLVLLYFAFSLTGKISMNMAKKNELKAKGMSDAEASAAAASASKSEHVPGEVYAVIGLALHEMQEDVHDMEDMVLTIGNEHERTLSPWNAKSLTMRHLPYRKR